MMDPLDLTKDTATTQDQTEYSDSLWQICDVNTGKQV